MATLDVRRLAFGLLLSLVIPLGTFPAAQSSDNKTRSQVLRERESDAEFQKVPPVKMFDNLWYVGPGYVSAYLIQTSAGAILVDTAEEPLVTHVIESIQKTGTKLSEVKAILISHGHADHYGGADRIRELSGAPVYATEEDWRLIETAAARPNPIRTPKRDRVVNDGDSLTVGDTTLRLYKTPGHTPGVISFEFTLYDNGVPHKAFYSGGTGGRDGIRGFEAAIASASRVMQFQGIEVFLPNHAWNQGQDYPNGSLFERFPRLAARRPGEANPFVDPSSWKAFISNVLAMNKASLERERNAARPQ